MTGVGLCLPQLGPHVTRTGVEGFCRRAEELGFTSLWVQDHFLFPLHPLRGYGGKAGAPIPRAYESVWAPTELLTAAAVWTSRVRLGTSVLVAGNHWPASLAQRLATIDQLSGGRLLVGLGVGWSAEEHAASGTDIRTRGERIEDFVDALKACWAPDPVRHDGPFFTIPPSLVSPKPVQRPHPPLLSGMSSEPGRRRTALHFDGWNPAGRSVAHVVSALAQMNANRPPGRAPLSVYHRMFSPSPFDPPATDDPLPRLLAEVDAAVRAGFEEVVVDCNFDPSITSPADWSAIPSRLSPLVERAAS